MATRVLISYTHDSREHMDRVWNLSERLRGDGLDCRIDQHEESPPEGWPRWCRNQVQEAQFVLVACTETYQRRYEGKEEAGKGLGGQWEGFVITQELYEAEGKNTKFVPLIFSTADSQSIPIELRAFTYYDLSDGENYDNLFRRLTAQPARKPAPIANAVRTMPTNMAPQTAPTPLPSVPVLERKSPSRTVTPQQIFTVPFPENRFFTGRQDVLDGLKTTLDASGVAALTGLSGIGKTQTAVRYAYDHRKDYEAVLWVRAESQETLFADLAQLAGVLQLPEREAKEQTVIVDAVKRWLDGRDGWLLVLDNVTDLPALSDFTERANIAGRHVIVTMQAEATDWIEGKKLKPMEQEVGASLLLRRAKMIAPKQHASDAKPKDADLARTLSTTVQGLPLALAQAGAYIEKTKCGLGGYLELLTKRFAEVMNEPGGSDVRHRPVVATFSLSLDQLAHTNEAAVELMKAAAFLPPDAIPEEIFTEGAMEFAEPLQTAALDAIAWDNAIAAALGFSLLERNQDDKTLAVHRMVQEVVKSRMSAEERTRWAEQVVRAVDLAFPYIEFAIWDKCERLVPSAQVCMGMAEEYGLSFPGAARLLSQAGYYLNERARYAEAELLYRRALAIDEKSYGTDHPNVAIRLNNLAELLRVTNRLDEAEPLVRRVIKIFEKTYGPDHPNVATSLNNLALLLQATNRLGEAEPLMRRALAIDEKALGPDHPDFAIDLNNLALLLKATNRLGEAEPLVRRLLEIFEKTYEPDHPNIATGLNNLAGLLRITNRQDEAEPLYLRALAIDEHAYGPDHPDVARDLNNLAILLQARNRLGEAEPLMRRALAIVEKSLGRDHPKTVDVRENLAGLLRAMGKDDEADKL
jgi:tetratricopeptide (TPR) repeat protein